jgi:TrmH family RNA methyltransferase
VQEVLASDFKIEQLFVTEEFQQANNKALKANASETIIVKPNELSGLGEYSTNDAALAIVKMKPNHPPTAMKGTFSLMLDDIRDPGNLGTIIRTADWYGIKNIIVSEETADVYNGKVVQSSMGSFIRVHIFYTNLEEYLTYNSVSVFGTFLDGENTHTINFGREGIIVIGNEANGISKEVERFVTRRIAIPRFGQAESLNAAIATAVVCDNIRRR